MKRLIVDVSSLCWTCLYAGTDEEFSKKVEHNGKTVTVNGWQHGEHNALNSLLAAWEKLGIAPKDTIMVFESGNSKGYRKRWLPTYCADRDSNRPPEYYTEFNTLKGKLIEHVQKLGGTAVTRQNLEADDVIAFLAQRLEGKRVIMTNDRDLAALITEDVTLWREGAELDENPYGPWPVAWMPIYKALVGDASDKIPGAKGFGEKAWLNLICIFKEEGVEAMRELIENKRLEELEEDVAELKVLRKVIDAKDMVYASYAAGKLYPQECENMRAPLQWFPGYVRNRSEVDDRLRKYAGMSKIVHADNLDEAVAFMLEKLEDSEFISLDLETTNFNGNEADYQASMEWLEASGNVVDVLASRIVSMGLTFGNNQQYNLYFTVGHVPTETAPNITMDQLKRVIESIPVGMEKIIANFSGFEAVVLRKNLGDLNGEYFLPNAVDVQIEAAYVDENTPRGLKFLSKHYLGADQVDYQTVTNGRRMDQMTAQETLAYGTDDTLFTSALHTHFNVIMEVEQTKRAFLETELDCQYVVAHSFLHGVNFDYGRMLEIEAEDDAAHAKARAVLDDYLIKVGYEGTVCPHWEVGDLQTPAGIKAMHLAILGQELKTQVRTPEKLFKLIADQEDVEDAKLLAQYMEEGNIDQINDWAASRFTASPSLDTNSSKQVQKFLYDVMGLPIHLVNNLTDNQRSKRDLADAMYAFKKVVKGKEEYSSLKAEQIELIKTKASTDDAAIQFALKYDVAKGSEEEAVLKAFQTLKEVGTRKSLFYEPWKKLVYWQDGKMHPSIKQSATTSLRFTASKPNVTQLGKNGEGQKLRSCFPAHRKGAVVISLDENAQELRMQAGLSEDPAFMACYVGDNKLDLHSVTAASILGISYEEFLSRLHSDDAVIAKAAKDKRKEAKIVNFLSAYSGTEVALSKDMVIWQPEAKVFLDAKKAAFPVYEKWQLDTQALAKRQGYVTNPDGARRHVAHKVLSDNKWEVEAAARSAGNQPIQSGSAAQTKKAMGAMWRRRVLLDYDCRFLMPVHDEVVLSSAKEDTVQVAKICHDCMTQPYLPNIPACSSISIGLNYADQPEVCEEVFDADAIQARLDELLPEVMPA